jgi:hypothetical protein
MKIRYAALCLFSVFAIQSVSAQRISVDEYIDTYAELAISEMKRSGIPASITLAQGILESANGNSTLATEGNNHFGIKCHDWEGGKMYHDDDAKGECFRKYGSAHESYIDHTDFLMTRSRYGFLFDYESTDYENWAKGLSKAGYATDPNYPERLISLIERYNLHLYDAGVKISRPAKGKPSTGTGSGEDFSAVSVDKYPVKTNNGTDYIVAYEDDTYASLSAEFAMMPWQLPKYNDGNIADDLRKGQIIYMQPKRRKAERGKNTHTVADGETMQTVSQKYAIKLRRLYKLNLMGIGSQPKTGDILNLRKKKK